MAVAVFCAALAAWAVARGLVKFSQSHSSTLDAVGRELRKVHVHATCRVGGIAILAGIAGGAVVESILGADAGFLFLLLVCVLPGLVWGLIEDISKRGAVQVRLALSAVAATLGFMLLDARLTQLDVPVLDALLTMNAIAFAFTVFAVTGVANAINVVDGLNGLSEITALLGAIGLAIVAAAVGDTLLCSVALILAASVAGFLVVNYPSGRVFLGDGGAYFVGLLLAELSVLLVHRNSEVSVWFPLVLLAYPIWETLFSMYRRRMRGRSTGDADALHLHSLVYRRVVRWKGAQGKAADAVFRNSLASLCLWALPLACFAVALAFWQNTLALQGAAAVFAVFYTLIYRRIVRFRVPRWLIVRAKRDAAAPRPASDLRLEDK